MNESPTPSGAADGAIHADMVITVAAPVRDDDADFVEQFVRETDAVMAQHFKYFEILLVDHGAGDRLIAVVEALQTEVPRLRLVRLSRAHNAEIAYYAALDCSIGDYVVLMDADRDPPALIPKMIEQCASGTDAVVGKTADKQRGLLHRLGSVVFYKLLDRMTGHSIDPDLTDFRAFSRRIVNSLVRIKDRNLYMKYLTEYVGYKQSHMQYDRISRSGRPEGMGILASTSRAVSILVANSNKPLRAIALVGLLASGVNLVYALFALSIGLFSESVDAISAAEGWASTNVFNVRAEDPGRVATAPALLRRLRIQQFRSRPIPRLAQRRLTTSAAEKCFMSRSGLIGATGFVGSNLLRQRSFDARYHSANIGEIGNEVFDLVICAAPSAVKWLANKHPDKDRAHVDRLMADLEAVRTRRFVLISTVDVYPTPTRPRTVRGLTHDTPAAVVRPRPEEEPRLRPDA